MTKDEKNAADRVAALEQEVEKSFREVCRAVSFEHHGWRLPDDLSKLHEKAVNEGRYVQGKADMAKLAQKHHDEVQKVADEVAALRKRAGSAVESFRKKFDKVKGHLDEKGLSAAAIHHRGVLHCDTRRLQRFVLHLLVTPGLLAQSRHATASQHREDEGLRSLRIEAGQNEAGYWPRVDAMLDVVEELGRGFTVEQLQSLKDLDVAEERFEELVASYSKIHEGKPWQEWPEVWSVAKQQERADKALAVFAKAFIAAKAWEDLTDKDSSAHYVRPVCRRHEKAVEQLTIARLEARVEALEAKLAGGKAARPAKAAPRAKAPSPAGKKRIAE
ncbi:MAG: hypothetical protein K8J09_06425 [Planctomycetes bacterium]|nr:hypothetical protein [Planctomycetota bacterium]